MCKTIRPLPILCALLCLHACGGNDFSLRAKSPKNRPSQDAQIIEAPAPRSDGSAPFSGRLLGGMQEPGGDEKLTAEELQKQQQEGVASTPQPDAKALRAEINTLSENIAALDKNGKQHLLSAANATEFALRKGALDGQIARIKKDFEKVKRLEKEAKKDRKGYHQSLSKDIDKVSDKLDLLSSSLRQLSHEFEKSRQDLRGDLAAVLQGYEQSNGQNTQEVKKALAERHKALISRLQQQGGELSGLLMRSLGELQTFFLAQLDKLHKERLTKADLREEREQEKAQRRRSAELKRIEAERQQKEEEVSLAKQSQAELRKCYQTHYSTLHVFDDKLPIDIDKAYIQLAIIEKEKDKKEKDEKDEKDSKHQTRDQLIESYESIYATKKNIALGDIPELFKKTRKVLLLGRAGIGKTTVCKKLAHMWAKGEWGKEFEAVYVLPIRVMNNARYERYDLPTVIAQLCSQDELEREDLERHAKCIGAQLKAEGFVPYAVELTPNARPYHKVRYPERAALIVGHEDHGVTKKTLAVCPQTIFMPMYGKGASLNVAQALTVAAYRVLHPESIDTEQP